MSRLRLFARSLFLASTLLIAHSCFCWGVTGHRIVAEIAQQHLSKKAKKEIKKLFGREALAWWANWGDFIKSDSNWNQANVWHYVHVEGKLAKGAYGAALKALPGKNLYSQTVAMMADLRNESLSVEQRQIALKFLIHFIGDLHQPLHVGGRPDDQGGNKIPVSWFDKPTNLHSLWDSGLIDFQQYSFSEYARLLDIASDDEVKAIQSGSLEDWFYESNQLAEDIYNASPADSKLSYRYNFKFQKMLDNQLLKGGLRLAKLLNETFD